MSHEPLIIAIDGPSAAGKTTLGRMLARALSLLYLDTGSMYRAFALAVIESGIDEHDKDKVGWLASQVEIDLKGDPDELRISLNGRDVTEEIRSEKVTQMSSVVSAIPAVRRALVKRQRELGRQGAVLNGRDIGTVVFPNATVKFFLTAEPKERAQRRFEEDLQQNSSLSFEVTYADISERDRRDETRADSPLKAAEDAILVDSTGLTISQVFERMMRIVRERSPGAGSNEQE